MKLYFNKLNLSFIKKLTAIVLVLVIGFTINACSSDDYNTEVAYGNISGNYATYGSYTYTNKDLYTSARVDTYSYFVDEIVKVLLADYIDELDYNNEDDYEDFIELLNTDLYGTTDEETIESYTTDEKATAEQSFRDGLYSAGFDLGTSALDSDTCFEYYKLSLAENRYALDQLTDLVELEYVIDEDDSDGDDDDEEEIENSYYISDDVIEAYYDSTYKGYEDLNIVVIGFETIANVNSALNNVNIDLTDDSLTEDSVKAAFIQLYNEQFSYKETLTFENFNEVTTMSYDDLNTYDASLVSFVGTLESGDYTLSYKEFGDKKYLIYLSNKPEEVDFEDLTDEDIAMYKEEIIENYLTSSYVSSEIIDLINESEITIYDPILANLFSQSYDYDFSSDFDNSSVALVNGTAISVDDYFDIVSGMYGVSLALDYFSSQMMIKSTYYTTDVTSDDKDDFEDAYDAIMDSFKDGSYETSGYPSSSDESLFKMDYFGYSSESDVLKYYYGSQKAIEYLLDDKNDLYFGLLESVGENFATYNYYSLDIKHVLLYVDYDMDGTMDNPTVYLNKLSDEDQIQFKQTLIDIYSAVKVEAEFLDCGESKALDYIAKQFTAGATLASDETTSWADIKGNKFNIQMKVEDLGTVDTSTATTYVTAFSDHVQSFYYEILENAELDDDLEIDDIYVENITSETTYEELCQTSYGYHMLVSLDAEEAPTAEFSKDDDTLSDDEYIYTNIVIEIDDEEVTIENAYSENSYASLNQLMIYVYEYISSDGVESLPTDVQAFIENYYSSFTTQYTNSYFQNYVIAMYIDYSAIEFTNTDDVTRLDNIINIAKDNAFSYAYDDNELFTDWWDITDDLISTL